MLSLCLTDMGVGLCALRRGVGQKMCCWLAGVLIWLRRPLRRASAQLFVRLLSCPWREQCTLWLLTIAPQFLLQQYLLHRLFVLGSWLRLVSLLWCPLGPPENLCHCSAQLRSVGHFNNPLSLLCFQGQVQLRVSVPHSLLWTQDWLPLPVIWLHGLCICDYSPRFYNETGKENTLYSDYSFWTTPLL